MTACTATDERSAWGIDRRRFLELLGIGAGAVGLAGCEWSVPERLVELALRGPGLETFRHTVCGLCEGGCGLSVRLVDGIPVGLKGHPRHPLNLGGLCPVGQAGLEVLYAPHRLRSPQRRGANGFEARSWDEALSEVRDRLGALRTAGQGDRLAVLTGETGGLFDDLVRAFLAALESGRVIRSAAAAALPYTLMQGLSEVPAFDLAGADLVLSLGLDVHGDGATPIYATSALVGSRPDGERAALIHAGSRMSLGAASADERVLVRPGTHGALALGLAHVLVREERYDRAFVDQRTFGFEDWTDEDGRSRMGFRRLLLERYYPDRTARLCGCEPQRVIRLARRLAAASAPLVVWGGEAAAGSNATWTGMAAHALNALLGSFDRPGGVTLAAPIPLTPVELPDETAPGAADEVGRDPVLALAEGVLDGSRPLEVLFVIGADPVHSSPAGERLREALEKIPLVVACTPFLDETAAAADWVLPAPVFLEAWQAVTTPAGVPFSVLGLGAPVIEPPLFDTRHPGDLLLGLAREVAADAALPWEGYEAYLRHRLEGLAIAGQGAVISSRFEDSWVHYLEERGWRFPERGGVEDFWNDLKEQAAWWNPIRAEGDWPRLLPTATGRFEFFSRALERRLRRAGDPEGGLAAEEALAKGIGALGLEASGDEACMPHFEPLRTAGEGDLLLSPFRPITGRGRLGVASPMVLEMFGYPVLEGWQTWVEIAPETAHELDLGDGDVVAVQSARGASTAVVKVVAGTAEGVVHMAAGLGHKAPLGAAGGIGSNPMELVADVRDPLSGAVSPTGTQVRLRLVRRRPHGGPAPQGGHG